MDQPRLSSSFSDLGNDDFIFDSKSVVGSYESEIYLQSSDSKNNTYFTNEFILCTIPSTAYLQMINVSKDELGFEMDNSPQASVDVPRSIGRGLFRASTTMGIGIYKGASGLLNQTYEGGANGGIFGFAKGLGMGMIGFGTSTVKGAVRGVGQVSNVLGEMVLGSTPHVPIDGSLVVSNYRILWRNSEAKISIPIGGILGIESCAIATNVVNIETKYTLNCSFAFENELICHDFMVKIQSLYIDGKYTFAVDSDKVLHASVLKQDDAIEFKYAPDDATDGILTSTINADTSDTSPLGLMKVDPNKVDTNKIDTNKIDTNKNDTNKNKKSEEKNSTVYCTEKRSAPICICSHGGHVESHGSLESQGSMSNDTGGGLGGSFREISVDCIREMGGDHKCDPMDVKADYERLGFLKAEEAFSLYDNREWVDFPSYPSEFIVPSGLTPVEMQQIRSYRSAKRIPAIVWRHEVSKACMARSAQPCVGISGNSCNADRKFMKLMQTEKSFYFIDARSQIAAAANAAQGKGTEDTRQYSNAELLFCDIGNIHAVRTAYHQLKSACVSLNTNLDEKDDPTIPWMNIVSSILVASIKCSTCLMSGHSILVHCSDGWDRTPQLTSITQILLDPYYRTIYGFLLLLEKEWIQFGHMFKTRYGQGDAPMHQDVEEQSPVFIQFLDCIYQIHKQAPWAFEFRSTLLEQIYLQVYACRTTTFLFNTVQESHHHPSISLWNMILHQKTKFESSTFDETKSNDHSGILLPFEPNALTLWDHHYKLANPLPN